MSTVKKDGTGRGPQFDRFPSRQVQTGHGPQYDKFSARARNPHGPQSDQNFDSHTNASTELDRAIARLPESTRKLVTGCPCGRRQSLEDALQLGQRTPTNKTYDHLPDVNKSRDEPQGEPDSLHAALVASIRQTYGI
jgi:hypothetical protein